MRRHSQTARTLLCLLVIAWCPIAPWFVAQPVIERANGEPRAAVQIATGDAVLAVRVEHTADYYHLTRRELVNETRLPIVLVLPASFSRILAAHEAAITTPNLCEFARREVSGVRLN